MNKKITSIHKELGLKNNEKLDVENFKNLKIILAFVTFEDFNNLQTTYHQFKKEYKKGCCNRTPDDPKFYLKGKKIKMISPDLPSNIVWENVGYSSCKRFFRIFIIIIFILILLIISTVLVLGLTSFRESSKVSQATAQNECVEAMSVETYESLAIKTEFQTFCFCQHQPKISILNDSKINGYCSSFITEQSLIYVKQIGAAVLISVVDLLFAFLIVIIIRFVITYFF